MRGKIIGLLFVGCFFFATAVKAQEPAWDTMFVAKGPLPDGLILLPAPGMGVLEGSDNLVEIRSRKGSIYNMQDATVVRIFAVEGTLSVVLRTKKDEYYVYSNLATVCPSVGEEVAAGVHLGECLTDNEGWFVLELAKSEKDKFLSKAEVMKLLWLLD
jgi:hypothetical protein